MEETTTCRELMPLELDDVRGGMLSIAHAASAPGSTDQLMQVLQQVLSALQGQTH